MDTSPTDPLPFTLLECAYRQLTRELCRALPPPHAEAEREDRDKAAIARVVALQPANTAEFEHAALFVIASARAKHWLACADEPGLPPARAEKLTSKADHMMRHVNAATRSLLRLQAARHKIETDPKAYDRGERIEHQMTVLMTGAIADQPLVSPDDPESQIHQTEILTRQLAPTPIPIALTLPEREARAPGISQPTTSRPLVSSNDPESHTTKTETPPRRPVAASKPATTRPPHPGAPVQATHAPRPVSGHDTESHIPKTETHPRQSAPTQRWRPARPGYDFPLSDLATDDAV